MRRAYEFAGSQAGETQALVKPSKVVFSPEKFTEIASEVPSVDPGFVASRSPPPGGTRAGLILNSLISPRRENPRLQRLPVPGPGGFRDRRGVENPPLPLNTPDGAWFLYRFRQ